MLSLDLIKVIGESKVFVIRDDENEMEENFKSLFQIPKNYKLIYQKYDPEWEECWIDTTLADCFDKDKVKVISNGSHCQEVCQMNDCEKNKQKKRKRKW